MSFRIHPLPFEPFAELFSLSDEALAERGAARYIVDATPGFPCRVSLEDAVVGETVILTPYTHQPAESPYRASGPVFVREGARPATPGPGEVPPLLRLRTLSVRAYDATARMIGAEVVPGPEIEGAIARRFADARAAYLHVHYAGPGCYACRVDRLSAPGGNRTTPRP